jgi:hypothetical protein
MKFRRHTESDETGTVLVIALLFLTFIALTLGGLLALSTANLAATGRLDAARSLQYDSDAAMQAAIATIRVTQNPTFVQGCASYAPTWTVNNPTRAVRVFWCPQLPDPTSPGSFQLFQRQGVFSVCPGTPATPCQDTQSLLRASVTFYDDQSFGRAVAISTWSSVQ